MFTARDRDKCQLLFEKHYAGRKFHDALYGETIFKHLVPGQRLLDAGCGRYLKFSKRFSQEATVIGIDLDSVLETDNQNAPYAVRGDLHLLPFPAEYFDMVISRSVIEHLEDPTAVFVEFARVLKPGGKVVVITPNKYDYVSVLASITPYKLHRFLVSKLFRIPEDDVFPTLYRANTLAALDRAMSTAGFAACEIDTINHYPAYLMFSPMLFRIGVLYERLTSFHIFRALRGSILAVFAKPTALPRTASCPPTRWSDKTEVTAAGKAC